MKSSTICNIGFYLATGFGVLQILTGQTFTNSLIAMFGFQILEQLNEQEGD